MKKHIVMLQNERQELPNPAVSFCDFFVSVVKLKRQGRLMELHRDYICGYMITEKKRRLKCRARFFFT